MAMQPSSKAMTFGQAFKAARAAGDSTFEYGGKKYTTELASSPNRANKVGTAPSPMRDEESGMSRGTRNFAGAGRGGQGGQSLEDIVNGPASYDAGAGRGTQGTAAEGYKKGGRVTGYKGYGKAKKV